MSPRRRPLLLLAAGAALGLALAAAGLLGSAERARRPLPGDAVARVNGMLIRADTYARLVAGFESDTARVADEAARRHVLDRLIDEEVLVQRGIELGLAQSDRRVRADVVGAMIRSVLVEVEDAEPSEGELEDFYAAERAFFTQPGRLRVRQILFRSNGKADGSAARARERLLAGEPFASVRAELGRPVVSPIPDALLPAAKLREYIGPTALRTALSLEPGEISAPVRSGIGTHLLQLLERESPYTPPFETIREQVLAEWKRRQGDRALRAYLDALRDEADITVAAELP